MKTLHLSATVLAACAALAGCSSAPLSPAEGASSSPANDGAPRAEAPQTTRLANGMLKLSDGATTRYLKPTCDPKDKTIAHCESYEVVDENAKPLGVPTPAGVSAPASICPQNNVNYYCIGANDIAQAYAIPTYMPSSATVAILGFSDSPNFESDMNAYRSAYGLPACTSASGCFKKVNQNGGTSLPGVTPGGDAWSGEETLDLQMASAGCPTCKIVLIESTVSLSSGMMPALQTAQTLGASALSVSGGTGEWSGETSLDNTMYEYVGQDKIAVFASSGDNGAEDTTGDLLWPAVNPWVNAVGGTVLNQTTGATFPLPGYWGTKVRGFEEIAWVVSSSTTWGGAGWGCSAYEQKPFWQTDTGCSNRTVSDISAVAGDVYDYYTPPPSTPGGTSSGGWKIVWGTSIASPIAAAIYAQTGQPQAASGLGSGFSYEHPNDLVPAFMDITSNGGTTGTCPSTDPRYLCNAETGYDGPTGNGTPFALNLGPQSYATSTTGDRFWHDAPGNVFHQNGSGNVTEILTASSSGYGASSSVASYAYPVSGETAWYLDTLKPPHLRQTYVPPSGGATQIDWGTAPAGCTWTKNPAATSWGEGRADLFVLATCSGATHLFHGTWFNASYPMTDITPPGVSIGSSPAATSTPGVLDVIVLNTSDQIVHGGCFGDCTTGGFTWDAPSQGMFGWASDPALASPSPGVLFAFDVTPTGHIVFSEWSWASPNWLTWENWYEPSIPCQTQSAPTAARSAENNLFVGCTATNGALYAGWGGTSESGTWWWLGSGVVGGAGFATN